MVPAGDSGYQTQVMRTMKRYLEKGLITRLQIPLHVGISGPPMDRPRATLKGEGEDLSRPRCNFPIYGLYVGMITNTSYIGLRENEQLMYKPVALPLVSNFDVN